MSPCERMKTPLSTWLFSQVQSDTKTCTVQAKSGGRSGGVRDREKKFAA
jgi:hypothetical protein